ncbi:MAG: patatin-like phospholipase family protein [Bryobacteraceae bacterium]
MLSAGGMFGAYQAGVWKALSGRFHPEIVVGASVGALNAWAIAGGVAPGELIEHWLAPECASLATFRLMQPPWLGVFDARPLHAHIRRLWETYLPRVDIGVVATGIPRFRPRLFRGPEIGWLHLAASCAVLLCYPQVRIEGRVYSDGGLLGALPVWAAARMGATRIVAVNVLARAPSRLAGWAVRGFRTLAPGLPATPAEVKVCTISPSRPMGRLRDTVFWRREAVERWIEMGEEDAMRDYAWRLG